MFTYLKSHYTCLIKCDMKILICQSHWKPSVGLLPKLDIHYSFHIHRCSLFPGAPRKIIDTDKANKLCGNFVMASCRGGRVATLTTLQPSFFYEYIHGRSHNWFRLWLVADSSFNHCSHQHWLAVTQVIKYIIIQCKFCVNQCWNRHNKVLFRMC